MLSLKLYNINKKGHWTLMEGQYGFGLHRGCRCPGAKTQWNMHRKTKIPFKGNAMEDVVYIMSITLYKFKYVNDYRNKLIHCISPELLVSLIIALILHCHNGVC